MKTKFTLVLGVALLAGTSVFAQKVTDKDISFEYKRLPMQPLGKTFTNYQCKAELTYLTENATRQAEYEKLVQAAEAKYQQDLKEWEAKDKEAEEKYQKEMEEYNKKSGAQKMLEKKLLEEGKPVKQHVYKPVKEEPVKPILKKVHDPSLIAGSYLKLENFNNSPENAVVVTAMLNGFDVVAPQMKTETSSYLSNGQATTVNTYYYETSYKFPVAVKVEVPGKGVVYNQVIDKCNEFSVAKTSASKSSGNPITDQDAYLRTLEEKILAENMKYVNELVNDQFGTVKLKRTAVIYNVETKKVNYDDYNAAFENAIVGYNMLAGNKEAATAKIKAAIEAWEKALTESNTNDKKARVNADITVITRLNLAEAYTWVDDYANAEMQLLKLNALDPSRKQKKYAEELSKLMKDQKQRYDAGKSI